MLGRSLNVNSVELPSSWPPQMFLFQREIFHEKTGASKFNDLALNIRPVQWGEHIRFVLKVSSQHMLKVLMKFDNSICSTIASLKI